MAEEKIERIYGQELGQINGKDVALKKNDTYEFNLELTEAEWGNVYLGQRGKFEAALKHWDAQLEEVSKDINGTLKSSLLSGDKDHKVEIDRQIQFLESWRKKKDAEIKAGRKFLASADKSIDYNEQEKNLQYLINQSNKDATDQEKNKGLDKILAATLSNMMVGLGKLIDNSFSAEDYKEAAQDKDHKPLPYRKDADAAKRDSAIALMNVADFTKHPKLKTAVYYASCIALTGLIIGGVVLVMGATGVNIPQVGSVPDLVDMLTKALPLAEENAKIVAPVILGVAGAIVAGVSGAGIYKSAPGTRARSAQQVAKADEEKGWMPGFGGKKS